MTKVNAYDDSAEKLEELAERYDITVAEVIDVLLEYSDEAFEG